MSWLNFPLFCDRDGGGGGGGRGNGSGGGDGAPPQGDVRYVQLALCWWVFIEYHICYQHSAASRIYCFVLFFASRFFFLLRRQKGRGFLEVSRFFLFGLLPVDLLFCLPWSIGLLSQSVGWYIYIYIYMSDGSSVCWWVGM